MKNNESGEFELVLGNKQLLSGFFIVVILFAVFFTMGYIVGRNSTPAPQLATNANPPGTPLNTRPEASSGSIPSPQNSPAAAEPKDDTDSGTKASSEPQPTTQAAQTPPAPKAEVPAQVAAAPADPSGDGKYLQVISVAAHDAEMVAGTLKDKGFPSSLSPAPNGKTTRVLVGPYADLAALGKAKADLEKLGFHPIVKR